MKENLILLKEVESELIRQKKEIQDLFDQNVFRIEKAESYLKDLTGKEADDFKVFSPRSIENVYRDRIEKETSNKKAYEKENESYQEKLDSLEDMIQKIRTVIQSLSSADLEETDGLKEISDGSEPGGLQAISDGNEMVAPQTISDGNETVASQTISNENETVASQRISDKNVAHQIMNCVSYITVDSERARIELTALAKKIGQEY